MNIKKKNFSLKKQKTLVFLTVSILILIILSNYNFFNNSKSQKTDQSKRSDNIKTPLDLKTAGEPSLLFQGTEQSLNITDYGNLYSLNQEISITNQEEESLSYYLDDSHNWKTTKIENYIKNLQDKRNWINNSGFQSPLIYRVYENHSTAPYYEAGHSINWNNPSYDTTITNNSAELIRVHFVKVEFETGYDYLYICNDSKDIYYVNSTGDTDFYSPWVHGNTINLIYESDGSFEYFGYEIDYYEYVNSTSNFYDINSNEWEYKYQVNTNGFNYYGTAEVGNSTAMFVGIYGNPIADFQYGYTTGAFSEIYQDFTIPSGPVVEAYLSFDYYCQYALPTNDHYIYVKLNDQKIYSKGMLDISALGRRKWLKSGKLYTDAWDNVTEIFKTNVDQQPLNISLGFTVGAGYSYTGVEDEGLMNVVYFDNISLVVTTEANSTQSGIDLRINSETLEDNLKWGQSNKTLTGLWENNPIILTINSSSPYLTFDMNTTIFGYTNGVSTINQQSTEGISYQILKNGSVYWEFKHNFYMPSQYSDFEIVIMKPTNWQIISVKDPTLQSISFEGGNNGDRYVSINKTNAVFPGW